MEVTIVSNQRLLSPEQCRDKIVVVIDVFRATSFIVTAFAHHCAWIRTVATIEEAKRVYQPGDLLAGERQGQPIPSFHVDNSPLQIKEISLRGRGVILTTTNGTVAIDRAHRAKEILAGALLNAKAVARYLANREESVLLLCAGSRGRFALEDDVAAGCILAELLSYRPELRSEQKHGRWLQLYQAAKEHDYSLLKQSESGKRLRQMGKEDELHFCLQCNRYSCVPSKPQQADSFSI